MIDIVFIFIFVILNEKLNIMCYYILNYDKNIIFNILNIKMSCIIVFLKISESVIYWDFCHNCFEAVKELHKLLFQILININNLHLLFFGHQVKKYTCQCISPIKVKLHSSIIFPKKTNLSSNFQQVSTKIGCQLRKLSVFLLFFGESK